MLITKWNSWIIAVSAFVINFLVLGAARLSPLLYVESIHRYNVDRSAASFPFVLVYLIRGISGPVVGYLGKRFGEQCVTSGGCLISAVGVGVCFFAEDILTVTVFWGIIYGFGSGAGSLLIPHILNLVFHHNKTMANGFSLAGSSVGSLLMPILVEVMLRTFGLSGTFLLISAMVLHSVPASMLLKINDVSTSELNESANRCESNNENYFKRGTETSQKFGKILRCFKTKDQPSEAIPCYCTEKQIQPLIKSDEVASAAIKKPEMVCVNDFTSLSEEKSPSPDLQKVTLTNTLQNESQHIRMIQPLSYIHEHPKRNKSNLDSTENTSKEVCNYSITFIKYTEKNGSAFSSLRVFLDLKFLVISLYHAIFSFIGVTMSIIFVDFLRDKGIDTSEEIYFLIGFLLSDLLGRLCLGWVTDRGYLSSTQYLVICYFLLGLTLIVTPWTNTFVVLICVLFLNSFLLGALIVVFPGVIEEFIEPDFRAMAMSSRLVLYLPLSLITSSLIGYCRETLGSYNWMFYILAASSFLCCFFVVIPARLQKQRN